MSDIQLCTVALAGVDGHLVHVQAHTTGGRPELALVGVAEHARRPMRDRVRAAVLNSGHAWPDRPVTVRLLPAALPTPGSYLDLAVACAGLAAAGQLPTAALQAVAILGELGLHGSVHPVRGVLAMVLAAARAGIGTVIVPAGNSAEAALAPGIRVYATDSLRQLVDYCHGRQRLLDPPTPAPAAAGPTHAVRPLPPADAAGQHAAEMAAAGGHHLAIVDRSSGSRARLAGWLAAILPDLDEPAACGLTALACLAGPPPPRLLRRPPLQTPHHGLSVPELLGGGFPWAPRPGVVSLAHHGVLLLEQAPQFQPQALQALRQPVEHGQVLLHRAGHDLRLPGPGPHSRHPAEPTDTSAQRPPARARRPPAGSAHRPNHCARFLTASMATEQTHFAHETTAAGGIPNGQNHPGDRPGNPHRLRCGGCDP